MPWSQRGLIKNFLFLIKILFFLVLMTLFFLQAFMLGIWKRVSLSIILHQSECKKKIQPISLQANKVFQTSS